MGLLQYIKTTKSLKYWLANTAILLPICIIREIDLKSKIEPKCNLASRWPFFGTQILRRTSKVTSTVPVQLSVRVPSAACIALQYTPSSFLSLSHGRKWLGRQKRGWRGWTGLWDAPLEGTVTVESGQITELQVVTIWSSSQSWFYHYYEWRSLQFSTFDRDEADSAWDPQTRDKSIVSGPILIMKHALLIKIAHEDILAHI